MSKVYDLEQSIMTAWQIVDDLKILYDNSDGIDQDELQNALLGIIQVGDWKFDKLFKTYEEYLKDEHKKKSGFYE